MGGFGGGRDMGGGGNSNRERGAARNRKQSAPRSASTNTGDGGNKPTLVSKVKDVASSFITARAKASYNVANFIPGMKKGLVKNRTDYKDYLNKRGNSPDFLNVDNDTLSSFDTFQQVRNFKPTQTKPNSNTLNYADYLAEEKGNFNLKYSGNVGNRGNQGDGMANRFTPEGIELAKSATGSATILGPAEIQKNAANTTATKMTASQTNVANKRKGRKATNLTAKSGLNDNYTLSSKSLLG